MSRYKVEVRTKTAADVQATIGYDRPLRTFFLTAFVEQVFDVPELWLGAFLEEYPSLEGIVSTARLRAYEIHGLRNSDMIAMMAEAGKPTPPNIGEIVGLVR